MSRILICDLEGKLDAYRKEVIKAFGSGARIIFEEGKQKDIYGHQRVISPGTKGYVTRIDVFGCVRCLLDEVVEDGQYRIVNLHPHFDKFRLLTEEELLEEKIEKYRKLISEGTRIYNHRTGELFHLTARAVGDTWEVNISYIPQENHRWLSHYFGHGRLHFDGDHSCPATRLPWRHRWTQFLSQDQLIDMLKDKDIKLFSETDWKKLDAINLVPDL